jgi:hypothetical protein
MFEARYLLDENVRISEEFAEAAQAILARQIVKMGTTDINLRKEAIKRGLVIVTQDQKFILHSMRLNVPIIWKYRGFWYLARGNFELLDNPFDDVGKFCRVNDTIILP